MKCVFHLIGMLLAVGAGASEATQDAVKRLRDALGTVDRVVLVRTFVDPRNPTPSGPLPEFTGAETLRSLVDTIEIQSFDRECECLSSPAIQFQRGNGYRFAFTLHHGTRLRSKDGPWFGDAVLTETSAERFRAWFAAHGYDGFVLEWSTIQKFQQEKAVATERVLSAFPKSVRPLLTEEEQYDRAKNDRDGAAIVAAFADPRQAALACWRAWGEVETQVQQPVRAYVSQFTAALRHVPPEDRRAALTALPDDAAVWRGAYLYAAAWNRRDGPPTVDDATLCRLAERRITETRGYDRYWVVHVLDERASTVCDALLLRIGAGELGDDKAETRSSPGIPDVSTPTLALLNLAARHHAGARDLIVRRLAKSPASTDRLMLEVALAYFDGASALGLAHLDCNSDGTGDQAWKLMSEAPEFHPTVEFMTGVANSRSYTARKAAEVWLRERGLKLLAPLEQADQRLAHEPYASAQTVEAITRLINGWSGSPFQRPQVEELMLNRLHQRRGELHLARGDYEEALLDFSSAGRVPGALQRLAFVEQTLGRFSAATLHGRMAEREAQIDLVSEELEARAYRLFALADYAGAADAFRASRLVSFKTPDLRGIMRHFAVALAGSPEPLPAKYPGEPRPGLQTVDEPQYWPDTAWRFMAGQSSEADVIGRIPNAPGGERRVDRCQAEFVLSLQCRVRGDEAGERRHIDAALATACYAEQTFSLAQLRDRQLKDRPPSPNR